MDRVLSPKTDITDVTVSGFTPNPLNRHLPHRVVVSKSPLQAIQDITQSNNAFDSLQSIVNGSNCLLPVSNNEDLQIKAALVSLKKLKLDMDLPVRQIDSTNNANILSI